MIDEQVKRFVPRPDQPDRYDQQESFYHSRLPGISWLLGGNGAGTSECALAKAANFLRTIPAPRPDTPFWVIAGSYEQVMEACWKEKLYGHNHISRGQVDWDRVHWYRPNNNWPFRVPLRPWHRSLTGQRRDDYGRPDKHGRHVVKSGCNWSVEFKSWKQGRAQMQARSLGGFLFVEQFPWGILEEVLRGCREYDYLGNKLCEFTPVDPSMSIELQEMIENDTLPPGWEIFRGNTECSLEAGHISQQWYDEFFGMVPEEMRLVRQIGEFAGFDGQIFQGFNPAVHCVDDTTMTFPREGYHRRAIDWGSGGEHAFCCLWAYKDGLGRWWIYDEYYDKEQRTTPEYLAEVHKISEQWGWDDASPMYGMTWADSADPDAIRMAQKLPMFMPGTAPMPIAGANKSVRAGIEHVQHALGINPRTKTPGLFIHGTRCPNLKRQLRSYRWMKSADTGLNPKQAPKEPLKRDDHAVDPLRYLIYSEAAITNQTIERISHEHRDSHGVRFVGR